MKKLLITAFALLAFAAGSQAQTNNKNAKNMKTCLLYTSQLAELTKK